MAEAFQRLFHRVDPQVMSLNVQAAMGPVVPPQRSQSALLLRHFLERFFNHETASPDGDGKTRMVQIACAAGLPGLMVGIYLWPLYHPLIPLHQGEIPGPPPYWAQVNHHFFFVMYSFVALGLATVFQWDLFFPDQLDVFVLGTLPAPARRVFLARVGAIAVFVLGFLLDANALAPFVLPAATDPPNLARFLAGHLAAVFLAGLFAAVSVLAAQSLLLALLGERLFRKISLAVQGMAVTALLMLLLLFPVLSSVTPALIQAGGWSLAFPPFWFLGVDQWLLEGPSALPVYSTLAGIGCGATLAALLLTIVTYPLAYVRRTRALVEGSAARSTRHRLLAPLERLLDATLVRPPVRRAVFHFIGQTILRVPRYRIYLVLYGGAGLSMVAATILRFTTAGQHLRAEISADGVRAAIGIVAFWITAGLRTAFASSGNQRGGWVWRIVHGAPPEFATAMERLRAAKVWVMLCSLAVTLAAVAALRAMGPPELRTPGATAAAVLVAAGLCVLLTDAFFLNVVRVPFTGEAPRQQENLAFTVLKYYMFFPFVTVFSVAAQYLVARGARQFGIALAAIVVMHLWLARRNRDVVRLDCGQLELEEGEDDFPMRLGLRY